ncbi:unnamed protein product [Triticum turgidum subsp. durum]|uniref:Uncharacterized protein n=1 Tax=Triticum turgidum subsp. durum TaxID=4567 RepID=A0A9R1QY96_TRITD|nr:unnamed protein product [Triticum turgidum subsp. durum]
MSSMDCAIHVVLGVVMRRSICRLHEVVAMAVELGTVLLVAVRFSGMAFRRTPAPTQVVSGSTHYYYYAPVAASMVGMSRLDRH